MTSKPKWHDVRRQPFLFLAFVTALAACACALWWGRGDENVTVAFVLALTGWGSTGILAFVSGYRFERREWNVRPIVHGVATALIALGVTFGAMFFAAHTAASAEYSSEVRRTTDGLTVGAPDIYVALDRW